MESLMISLIVIVSLTVFIILSCSILYKNTIKIRTYEYKGHSIFLFTGWRVHYLEIDGQVVHEIKRMVALSLTLNGDIDGAPVKVKIMAGLLDMRVVTTIDGIEVHPLSVSTSELKK